MSYPQARKGSGARFLAGGMVAAALMMGTSIASAQVTPVEIESGENDLFSSRVLSTGLDNPWAMQWGPQEQIWLTERTAGEVTRVDPETGAQQLLLTLEDVYTGPQHEGLLGMAIHPEMGQETGNDYVYIAYTINNGTAEEPDPAAQIVRYTWDAQGLQLTDPMTVIEGLTAWNDHNAGRVLIGPDNMLYYSIGDHGANFGRNQRRENLALTLPTQEEIDNENWRTYSGKILRMNLDGSIPEDNPELDGVRSHIYSYGHRNPQGIDFAEDGTLYQTEHGPATGDELNIIRSGGNYGWPWVSGYIDGEAYTYIDWSEAPDDVNTNADPLPDSVPQYPESEFEGDMIPPLAAYWVVGDDYPIGAVCGYICDPTIAPSSVKYYEGDTIPEFENTVLIPTLKHGTLYVQHLNEDGTAADGLPVAWFSSQNRYRDVLVSEDGSTIYLATDAFGSAAQKFGEGLNTSVLHNPGAILKFTYQGDEGSGVATVSENDYDAGPEDSDSSNPQEWEDPATGGAEASDMGSDDVDPADVDNMGSNANNAQMPEEDAPSSEADDAGSSGSMNENGDDAATSEGGDTASVTEDASIEDIAATGRPIYVNNCSSCHGAAGQGGAGAVLAGDENLADASFVAETLVHGFGYMPAFGNQLSDDEIARVGTYIRNSWGNDFGVLTEDAVAAAR